MLVLHVSLPWFRVACHFGQSVLKLCRLWTVFVGSVVASFVHQLGMRYQPYQFWDSEGWLINLHYNRVLYARTIPTLSRFGSSFGM
jgi:hypothetical protein